MMLPGKQHQKKASSCSFRSSISIHILHNIPILPFYSFFHSRSARRKKKATAKKERKTRKLSYTRDSGGIWNVSQDQAEVSESEMANRINRAERMRRTRASGNEEFSLFLASFHGLCRGRSSNKSRKQVFRIAGFVASMFYLFCSFLFWSKLVFYFFFFAQIPF